MRINQPFNNELVTVIKHGLSESQKGTPYVWFEFEFDGLQTDEGETLTARAELYLSDAAAKYTLEKLETLGWVGTSPAELNPENPGAFPFEGRKVRITGDIETYNGKVRPRVRFINDPDNKGFAPKPIDKAASAALDGRLRGKIAMHRANKANPKPTAAPAKVRAGAVKDTDEIPF